MLTILVTESNPLLRTLAMRFRYKLGRRSARMRIADLSTFTFWNLRRVHSLLLLLDGRVELSAESCPVENDPLGVYRLWAAKLDAADKELLRHLGFALCVFAHGGAEARRATLAVERLLAGHGATRLLPALETESVAPRRMNQWCDAFQASLNAWQMREAAPFLPLVLGSTQQKRPRA